VKPSAALRSIVLPIGFLPVVRADQNAQDAAMGEIVNLRRMKKQRDRDAAAASAKQNRIRHGRTKVERANDARTEQQRQALLDALRRGEPRE
jgi:Domain of unknown function (DUF4169)